MSIKSELRKEYLSKRQSLSGLEQNKLNDLLLIQLQSMELPFANILLSYIPMEDRAEPDTFLFSDYIKFLFPQIQIGYPITNMKLGTMEAYLTNEDTEFEKVQYGLIEPVSEHLIRPEEVDIVIVPLLVADRSGYRVGYGKGMYDKFLSRCRNDVFKIGFSFSNPIEQILDIDRNDISLDVLICPNQKYFFK
ncbi:MAG TPA: 5-formyltetrahydrofolate cyclo-ligase [Edaphocola sp.]|nr:5-formyltetrahydrofolate cyclo-ligase [Edaphocola sp.]